MCKTLLPVLESALPQQLRQSDMLSSKNLKQILGAYSASKDCDNPVPDKTTSHISSDSDSIMNHFPSE